MTHMEFGVVLLAGGQSRRMGKNKALLPVGGKPNIEHIRDELNFTSPHFVVVTNEPEIYRFLGEQMVSDRHPGKGPLAGIQAGLLQSHCDWNLVVACDMPFVSAEAAEFLLGQAMQQPADATRQIDAVLPLIDGQMHPLFAVYHKRCASYIEDLVIADKLRMVDLLANLRVKKLTEADFPESIDSARLVFNMNRPDEWEQAKRWMEQEGRRKE
jgi:molybdopterin-guanine dinucleotide biosynthesis protein A